MEGDDESEREGRGMACWSWTTAKAATVRGSSQRAGEADGAWRGRAFMSGGLTAFGGSGKMGNRAKSGTDE